jgi:hypothetical protein
MINTINSSGGNQQTQLFLIFLNHSVIQLSNEKPVYFNYRNHFITFKL